MTNAEINAELNGAKCYFSCYPDPVQTEMQTYIIAHAAGVGMDPIQLAKDAACLTCLSPFTLLYAKLYLLARIAQVSTDPVDLIDATACDDCIPYGMLHSIDTWNLVNDPSSPSTNPETIMQASRCFSCLLPQTLLEVQVYLLMLIVNRTAVPPVTIADITTGGGSVVVGSGTGVVIPPGRIRSAIVRQQGRIRNGTGLSGGGGNACLNHPERFVPVLSNAVYGTNGLGDTNVLITFDATVTCVCADGGEWVLYGSNNSDGSSATEVNTIPIICAAGPCTETVPVPLPVPDYDYLFLTQRCTDTTEYAMSNVIAVGDPIASAAIAANFGTRVVNNGGGAVGSSTTTAITTFIQTLMRRQLYAKMLSINVIAPDSLTAAITPLIVGPGSDPWTNANFGAGSLSLNGLKGNGVNTSLNTGIVPNTAYANSNSAGMTVYVYEAPASGAYWDMGTTTPNSSNSFLITSDYSGTASFYCYGATTGAISIANPLWRGYFSANRTGANATAIYSASPLAAHSAIKTGVNGSDGTRSTGHIRAFAGSDAADNPQNPTNRRLSFCAVHLGLTSAESVIFYNAIQTLRKAFGGGFVPDPATTSDVVADWQARVVENGGASLSSPVRSAVEAFWDSIITAGIQSKFYGLNVFGPTSLAMALTPLYRRKSFPYWTNYNFAAGDLTVAGLKGNGNGSGVGTKYSNTGFTPNSDLVLTSGGITVYLAENTSAGTSRNMGAMGNWDNSIIMQITGTSGDFSCWNMSGPLQTGVVTFANTAKAGFYSGSRTSGTAGGIYFANSTNAFAVKHSFTGSAGSLPAAGNTIFCHAVCSVGAPIGYAADRMSFAAFHDGLTSAETQALYNAVQALRTSLGGGYV